MPVAYRGKDERVERILLKQSQNLEYRAHELAGMRESKQHGCSSVNEHVGKGALDPKLHLESNSGIYLSLR